MLFFVYYLNTDSEGINSDRQLQPFKCFQLNMYVSTYFGYIPRVYSLTFFMYNTLQSVTIDPCTIVPVQRTDVYVLLYIPVVWGQYMYINLSSYRPLSVTFS
jgi:hypothetical protein